jgi:stage 0 sporulation protein B (sporulation initiation phosphotransferase)
MDKDWTTVEILSHSRHDWLNKIQLIKGNLELNKIDRVRAIVDEIILEAQHEARLSNLNMPKLTELLLTANWNSRHFKCEFEVIDLFKVEAWIDDMMYDWTKRYFQFLDQHLDLLYEHVLTISICRQKDKNIRFTFDLQGKIKDKQLLYSFLDESLFVGELIEWEQCTEEEVIFNIDVLFEE